MKIKIITTGGTIDKVYFDKKSEYQVGETQLYRIFEDANITFEYEVTPLIKKDSLDMTPDDRKKILDHIKSEDERRFVITHGTDTMIETAQALNEISNKTIVLTGSMQPSRFHMSDATFNIGFALSAVQLLKPGIYIAMNGQIFNPLTSRKNIEKNCFEPLSS